MLSLMMLLVFLNCEDFDEIYGPSPECAVVDLVNTPADEDE
jgi:hypothetical protein